MGESKYDFTERPRAVSKPPAPPLDPENDDVPDAAAAPIPPPSGGADATTSSPPEGSSGSNRDIGPHQTLYSASGVAGGILGLLLGGPVLALLFVGGVAYCTTRPEGDAAGDAARSLGDLALEARARAAVLDCEHDFSGKVKKGAGNAWARAQQLESSHDIIGRCRSAIESTWRKAVQVNMEHHIVERTMAMAKGIWNAIISSLNESDGSSPQRGATRSS